jgi:hypothetical protein
MAFSSQDIMSFGASVIAEPEIEFTSLTGGANNQLWHAQPKNAPSFVIKNYGADGGDRLRREWRYLSLLEQHKVPNLPRPLHHDAIQKLAAYSFVDGKKLLSEKISFSHIQIAAQHISAISDIPIGTIDRAKGSYDDAIGHIQEITDRISHLEQALQYYPHLDRLHNLVMKKLKPLWQSRYELIIKADLNLLFSDVKLYLSPSDFGFHNILATEKTLNFIDFEYAGADDLAKLAADFSLVPQIPIPNEYAASFITQLAQTIGLDAYFEPRVAFLRFIGQIKWACIILNEFLPEKKQRLSDASDRGASERREERLTLAEEFFERYEMTEFTP